ncbi:ATP-dependent nuclease [Roseateles amylovorans]|uniref:AAA family ATPase n=1 Tax=Roseateles amylovorans TaxID=2978473 RepID=A0ABY6B3N1_9BURK|nr:AAA family ATPase [Roseateles amylovorans]UXH79993.1 AAA family ATPase [Roseateles amylovorans]
MPDLRAGLQAKYLPQNRYANFGPSLKSVHIRGFRGVHDLKVDLLYPITAISGLNGAGKSTVGQLCLGAYRKPSTVTEIKRFYVRDFFPASVADPNPFGPDSSVVFEYNTTDPVAPQTLTVARAAKEWSGYKRQPERSCYYIGFTIYIPKVEQRDLSMYRSQQLTLGPQRPIPEGVRERVGRILGQQYDAMHFQGITHGQRSGELGVAQRFGAQYSENNMGFGEGRTLYLVDLMEHSPEQSLFVIEEPETSLHGNAQHELAKYLVDVCHRRHHQVILTTHSSIILDALPADARVMLLRDAAGVAAFPQMSAARAKSILTGGHHRDLSVLVEDTFAKLLLTEMIRRVDPPLLACIEIFEVGNTKAVRSGALLMARIKRPFAAVRDADVGPDPQNGLFSFPGTMPPEREVYMRAEVQARLADEFGIDVAHIFTQHQVDNHHDFTKILAAQTSTLPDFMATLAVRAYLDAIGNAAYQPIVAGIQTRLP